MQHRVGRAGMQAAAAGFADAHLLGDRTVRLELELGQDAGEIDARTEFGRQDVDLEPERAEPGLDAEMARRETAVARALVVPVGLLRGGDEGRMAGVLQLLGERGRRPCPSSAAPACRCTAPARWSCSGTRRPECAAPGRSRSCSRARCARASAASADRAETRSASRRWRCRRDRRRALWRGASRCAALTSLAQSRGFRPPDGLWQLF